MRAMEVVMDGLWQILFDPPGDFFEKHIDGKKVLSYSFEIASIDGDPHFFVRIPKSSRDAVEANIYSQYPDAEISVADDYTKIIPKDIPNKDWDLWGADYKLLMPNPYPIKTYSKFETEREALEEKRIDPLATLLEAIAKTNPGEHYWIQITAKPVRGDVGGWEGVPWLEEGKKLRDELARRADKTTKKRPLLLEMSDVLITGQPPGGVKEEKAELLPPEMKLTPGEREILAAIEEKMAKRGYLTNIRFIYLGKKEVFFKAKLRFALSFFSAFTTQNLNALYPYGQPYLTKIKKSWFLPWNLLAKRRLYLRKRSIFRKYCERQDPLFPQKAKWPSSFILNTEELATIFHFPGRKVASAPFTGRIEAKRGEAPSGLPTE